ncbi:MAG: hypothetical protein O2985_07915 [Proteobacteria bacterium]|nr:hypothetical protein [Pseudomonadota bacterium]
MVGRRYQTDCSRCRGLCCIVFAHAPENGFPGEKPANQACRHLTAACRCQVFGALESEGYTVCRAYDCHGAGPLVSAWIDAGGAAPQIAGTTRATDRLEDFRQLSRLHLLAAASREAGASALFDALDAVSLAYQRTGALVITAEASAALRDNEDLVGALLSRLSPDLRTDENR